jgi:thiopurine S-methyltransferase
VGRVRYGDVFAPIAGTPFEVVYERAFLCALPRRLWTDWGRRMAQLVKPGGVLAGFFFFDAGERGPPHVPLRGGPPHVPLPGGPPHVPLRGGPPFPLHGPEELAGLLEPAFRRLEDAAVPDSIDVFRGKERWQAWERA